MTTARPLPDVNDPVTAPFWAAARESRLAVQRCDRCGALRWQPAPICPQCLQSGGTWVDLSGSGRVYSFTVYHRAMHPGFADLVPYTVAMVQLDEGIRMVGMMHEPVVDLKIDEPVTAVYEQVTPEITVVRWAQNAEALPAGRPGT